jgi:hypothetical protein
VDDQKAFFKRKRVLAACGAHTREVVEEAIVQEMTTITAHDAGGWFRHCG